MTEIQLKTASAKTELLRLTTAGSVDDGKSTLIGRLLYDTHSLYEDQREALKKQGKDETELADLLDGLSDEREQGITIDIAYRYFATNKRRFIIADAPGHEQYTRNMVTGASNADLAIILIDARKGMTTQSKRHLFLASMMGIPHILVLVNKMDLVAYDQSVFDGIQEECTVFSSKLEIEDFQFMPISAKNGDMVARRGKNMDWYGGHTLLSFLENVQIVKDRNLIDFRFPVQMTIRPHQDFRGYAGRIESGIISKGEKVTVLPSHQETKVKSIFLGDQEMDYAFNPQSVLITLEDEVDVGRGSMIVRSKNLPETGHGFEATLSWFSPKAMKVGKTYLLKQNSRITRSSTEEIFYRLNVDSLHREAAKTLRMNEIGKVRIKAAEPVLFDSYRKNRYTGSFILIDEITNETVGAGIILKKSKLSRKSFVPEEETHKNAPVLWLTGLSGSGKTSIADEVQKRLKVMNVPCEHLDGDLMREIMAKDLGFTREERNLNIQRAGQIANLLSKHGVLVLASFISPYQEHRQELKETIGNFVEIYVNASLEVCEKRDVKGLYKKARKGEIENFTGISDPYEAPSRPDLELKTDSETIEESADKILDFLKFHNYLPNV